MTKKIVISIIGLCLLIFTMIVGGIHVLHRIAIIFTTIYLVFKLFLKDTKTNTIISIIGYIVSAVISLLNWVIMAIPEPSSFFRIFSTRMNGNLLNNALSQFASILNILMLFVCSIILLDNYNKNHIALAKLNLKDLQPSQFYISNKKIEEIEKWFKDDLSNFEAIPYKILNGRYVMTDGHTRAVVAIMHGINNIPCIEDMDELSLDMYEECVNECLKQGIHSPYDLVNRMVDEDTYHKLWDKWCDDMQKEVIKKRRNYK